MPITAAGVSAAGQLLGGAGALAGAFGGGSDGFDVSENLKFIRKKYKAAVQGAEAAGLHPLFALGSSANISPVTTIPGQSDTGSQIGRAMEKIGKGMEGYQLAQANLRAVNASASRDEAAAAEINSRRKRAEQDALTRGIGTEPLDAAIPGQVKHVPVEQKSTQPGSPGVVAGEHSFFKQYVLGKIGNQKISVWLPDAEEPAEAMENVGGIIASIPKNIYELAKWSTDPYARLIRRLYEEQKAKASRPHRKTRRGRRYR